MPSETDSTSDSVRSIARGASLYTIGKIISDAGEFALHLLVSRLLGANLYGMYAYGKTIAFMALLVTNVGANKSLLKYLPQYEHQPAKQEFVLALAYGTSLVGAAMVSGGLFLFAPAISAFTIADDRFIPILRLFAAILFIDTLANVGYATFRALEIIEYEILTKRILKPLFRVCFVGLALLYGASVYGVVVALAVGSLLAFFIMTYFFLTRVSIRPRLNSPAASPETVKSYYNYSVPLTAKDAGNLLQGRVDILMVGFFLSASTVGVYNVAVVVSGLLYIPLLAFNQLFPPVVSRLYTSGNLAELQRLFSAITRWIFTVSLFFGLFAIVFRYDILLLFGEEFTAGTTVLVLFVIGQLLNAATGPSGYVLMMTEHQYVVMANEWVFGILNIVLNLFFIQAFGILGAAAATAGVLALRNIVKVAEVWYFEQLFPYHRSFLKPIGAGVLAAIGMLVVQLMLPSLIGLVFGALVGCLLYGGSLWVLGISQLDRQLLTEFR